MICLAARRRAHWQAGRLPLLGCVHRCVSLAQGCASEWDREKILAAMNAKQGRQITTQFERDAERGAQRFRVGLRQDKRTDSMMEPAVSNTTFGCPKYCIFCMPLSQQGAYQRRQTDVLASGFAHKSARRSFHAQSRGQKRPTLACNLALTKVSSKLVNDDRGYG